MTSDSDVSLEYIGSRPVNSDETTRLHQINRKLKEDYDALKVQFDEAVKMSEQIDSLCGQNTSLSNTNRKLQAEIDEIQRRLDISLHLNDELNDQLKQEREANEAFINGESETLHQQIKSQEKQFTAKLSQVNKELASTQAALRTIEKEKKDRDSMIKALLETCHQRFGTKFTNLNILRAYIEQLPKEPLPTVPNDNNEALTSENIALRKKLKQMKAATKSLQAEVQQLKDNLTATKKEHDAELAKAFEAANEAKRQKNILIVQKDQEIEQLQRDNKGLEEQIAKDKTKISELTSRLHDNATKLEEVAPMGEEVALLNTRITEITEDMKKAMRCNKKMKKRIAGLVEEVKQGEETNDKLKRQVEELRNKNNEMNSKLQEGSTAAKELADENKRLKSLLDASTKEQESLNQKIVQAKSRISDTQVEMSKLRRTVTDLDETVTEQKSKVGQMGKLNQQQMKVISEQGSTIKDQAEQIDSLNNQARQLKEKLARQEQKAASCTAVEIPQSSWFCVDFPKDLASMITEIGKIESLQASAKLRQAFATIARYYSNVTTKTENKLAEMASSAEHVTDLFKRLLSIVNAHIGNGQFQVETFLSGASLDEVEYKLNDMQGSMEQLHDEKAKMVELIRAVADKLGVDKSNLLSHVSQVIGKMESQETQIKQLQCQIRHLKVTHNKIVGEMKQMQSEHDKDMETKAKEITDIISTKNEQLHEAEVYKLRIASLEKEVERLQKREEETVRELEADAAEKVEQALQELTSKYDSEILVLKQASAQEAAVAKKDLSSAERKISKLKHRIETLLAKNGDLEKRMKLAADEYCEAMKSMKQEVDSELEKVNQRHSSEIQQMEAAVSEKEEQILHLTKSIRAGKDETKRITELNSQLESEKVHLESKIASQKDEIEREKRLSETKLKTLTITTDLKLRDAIDDAKSKLDSEKRAIYHFGAELFKQFFDPRRQLTDESYRTLLLSAKNELSRMQKQEVRIRRILGAGAGESAESALARTMSRQTSVE